MTLLGMLLPILFDLSCVVGFESWQSAETSFKKLRAMQPSP